MILEPGVKDRSLHLLFRPGLQNTAIHIADQSDAPAVMRPYSFSFNDSDDAITAL